MGGWREDLKERSIRPLQSSQPARSALDATENDITVCTLNPTSESNMINISMHYENARIKSSGPFAFWRNVKTEFTYVLEHN